MCPSETFPGAAITVVDEQDERGGVIKRITAVDISKDTVTSSNLGRGYTAHDSLGNPVSGTAQICRELVGSLSVPDDIPELTGEIALPDDVLELDGELILPENTVFPPEYEDAYEVIPQAYEEVVLPTSGHYLSDDVVVLEIPYFTTTNPSGGYTAIIGG